MIHYKKFNGTFDIDGTVALVTGAANGIGMATAEALASRGVNLILLDVQAKVTEVAADLAERFTIEASGHVCDLTDRAQTQAAVDTAVARFGRIDILLQHRRHRETRRCRNACRKPTGTERWTSTPKPPLCWRRSSAGS